jgi:hypothetical protein
MISPLSQKTTNALENATPEGSRRQLQRRPAQQLVESGSTMSLLSKYKTTLYGPDWMVTVHVEV